MSKCPHCGVIYHSHDSHHHNCLFSMSLSKMTSLREEEEKKLKQNQNDYIVKKRKTMKSNSQSQMMNRSLNSSGISAYSAINEISLPSLENHKFESKANQISELSRQNLRYDLNSLQWSSSGYNGLLKMSNFDVYSILNDSDTDETTNKEGEENDIIFELESISSSESLSGNVTSKANIKSSTETWGERNVSSTESHIDSNISFSASTSTSPHPNLNLLLVTRGSSLKNQNEISLTERQKTYVKLALILSSINAPAYVYKEIYQWAQEATVLDIMKPIQQRTLIANLCRDFGFEGTLPHTSMLPLPSGNLVKVTKFGFASQLLSILEDTDLMKPENLIFDDENIFQRFTDTNTNNVAGDVQSGDWFIRTQKKLCVEDNDVLCPIIWYVDKTYGKGKPLEPLSFTIGEWN